MSKSAILLDCDDSNWKPVHVPLTGNSEYGAVAELHCADLALLPIFLTPEQAKAIERIMADPNAGPKVTPRRLPTRD